MIRLSLCRLLPALLGLAASLLIWTVFATPDAHGQSQKSDSKVKITATAGKPDNDGKQVVIIKLDIEKGWHAYANPVGEDFPGLPTTVTITAKQKPAKVQITYPRGKLVMDKDAGNHFIYEGEVTIKATVHRAKGDAGPFQVSVKIQTCNEKSCLLPATIHLTVP
jgi:DsbC/DsbD-like thiol-disulfide interchange protein